MLAICYLSSLPLCVAVAYRLSAGDRLAANPIKLQIYMLFSCLYDNRPIYRQTNEACLKYGGIKVSTRSLEDIGQSQHLLIVSYVSSLYEYTSKTKLAKRASRHYQEYGKGMLEGYKVEGEQTAG